MNSNETELIRRAQSGDREAFSQLAKSYERRIYTLARYYCQDPHDAEDLSQEVWLKAYRAVGSFRGEASFYTWLRQITIKTFLKHKQEKTLRFGSKAAPVKMEELEAADDQARTAKSPELRKRAIFWLGQKGGDTAIDELMKIFEGDQDVEVRKQVLFALSRMRSPRAQAKLLELARAAGDREIRSQAIFWLGHQGDTQAIDGLIQLYDTEKDEEIKERILFSLGQSGKKPALRKLMEVAKGDASPNLRKKAVFWLGQSRDTEAVRFLEEILK